ncbi:MAG: cell wall-binding repeat-containing protein [Chloroflexota bacterium]
MSRPTRVALLATLLAVSAFVTAAAQPGAVPIASAAVTCAKWTTTYAAPPTIRVYRHATDTVDIVPFRTYVENVLSWEWPSTYPAAALQAGAIAVKQYGWYYTIVNRSAYVTAAGACYDVRDDTNDQLYDPSRVPTANHLAAVEDTWPITLRKSGLMFLSGYGSGISSVCGADATATRTRLAQKGVRQCAIDGFTRDEILRTYLDPGLTITDAGRWFGHDRFATAASISEQIHAPGVPVVFVATGLDFPDALAAGPAAARLGGPVLLVRPDEIPAVVAAELSRLAPARIIVLGGTGAVSDAVVAALATFAPEVSRVSGADRYATAAATSALAFEPAVPIVFIATGSSFPDALVGAAAGARLGGPVLLVPSDQIPEAVAAELTRLQPLAIRVLGGPSVVGDAVLAALAAWAPDVARLAGSDRYETAAAVSAAVNPTGAATLFLATGTNFPDALAGGVLGAPILLARPGAASVGASVAMEIVRLAPGTFVALGGPGAIPDATITTVIAAGVAQ